MRNLSFITGHVSVHERAIFNARCFKLLSEMSRSTSGLGKYNLALVMYVYNIDIVVTVRLAELGCPVRGGGVGSVRSGPLNTFENKIC